MANTVRRWVWDREHSVRYHGSCASDDMEQEFVRSLEDAVAKLLGCSNCAFRETLDRTLQVDIHSVLALYVHSSLVL